MASKRIAHTFSLPEIENEELEKLKKAGKTIVSLVRMGMKLGRAQVEAQKRARQ